MKRVKFSFNSLFFKFPFLTLLTVVLLGIISILLTNYISFTQYKKDIENETSLILLSLKWAVSPLLEKKEISSIQRLIENIGAYGSVKSIRVYDNQYRVISSNRIEEVGKIIRAKSLKEVLEENKIQATHMDFKNNDYMISIPIKGTKYDVRRKSDVNAVLFLSEDLNYKKRILSPFRFSLIYENIFMFLVLSMVLIILIYRIVFVPLREFMDATREISEGNTQYRVNVKTSDEFGKFSKLFNEMLDDINNKNEMLKNQSQQLEKKVKERTKSLEEAKYKLEDAYDELRSKQNELLLAQKMEAVGRLAGGVAHDFNNMLTVIVGHSEYLLMSLKQDDSHRSSVEEILNAAKKSGSLTHQLLAFSRKQVLQPIVLDLNTLIMDIEKMLHRLIGEDINLVTILEPELGRVKADVGQMQQVIMNLAVNARDAMPLGGKIIIETSNIYLDEEYAGYHIPAKPGSYVLLAVSDTGTGMDKETQSHIFEPFFTTKKLGKGTGLGLSTVYGIIKQSDGYIWVYSESGHGTTFKIYLPRVGEDIEPGEPTRVPAPSLAGTETVLVVEDEDMVREIIRHILLDYGYNILESHNPRTALQVCDLFEGKIHLMVTDIVMPGMSGRELAEKATSRYPKMKILYISGYTDDVIVHHGILDSGIAFLPKPFTPYSLASKVREVLDSPHEDTT